MEAVAPAPTVAAAGGETVRLPDASGRLVTLHNPRDPWGEAREFAASRIPGGASAVVLLGAGAGHRVVAALERVGARGAVTAVAVNAAVFSRGLVMGVLDAVIDDPRLTLVYGDDEGLATLTDRLAGAGGAVLVHDAEMRVADEEAATARRLADHLATRASSPDALRMIRSNMAENLPLVCADTALSSLFGLFAGEPVVVAGAGPSLTDATTWLRDNRAAVRVVVVEAALTPLAAAGVAADLAVSVDAFEANARQCAALTEAPPLVYTPSVHPQVPLRWPAPRVAAMPAGDVLGEALDAAFGVGLLRSGGIVGTAAVALADALGASSIALVGMDLAFSGSRTHAAGAFHAARVADERALARVPGIGGEPVFTNETFRRAISWFELFASAQAAGRCVDLGVTGARKRGWTAVDPASWPGSPAPLPPWTLPRPRPFSLESARAVLARVAGEYGGG